MDNGRRVDCRGPKAALVAMSRYRPRESAFASKQQRKTAQIATPCRKPPLPVRTELRHAIENRAEGVETEQQFQTLKDLGRLQVQGYLLARPGPQGDVQALLVRRWGKRQ